MAKKPAVTQTQLVVHELAEGEVTFHIIGTRPLIMNRYQQKAWRELLFPSEEKNRAERAQTLKHNPIEEFRGSVYRNRSNKEAALIHLPNGALHGALASAALDMPGAKKAQMERLTRVTDVTVNLFGNPMLFMAMVRNSGMNRTPDVRTRAIFPEWAASVTVAFSRTNLTERTVGNLFSGAGMIVGIGDWRPQKGGPYGTWKICDPTDKDYRRIVKTQGRVAQAKALEKPDCYDFDTEQLYTWFTEEVIRREREHQVKGTAIATTGKSRSKSRSKGNGKAPPVTPIIKEDGQGNVIE
jgi:hypothetical protein